ERSMEGLQLVGFKEQHLHSVQDYLSALKLILAINNKTHYLDGYVAPIVADWSGQLFIRKILYQKSPPQEIMPFLPMLGLEYINKFNKWTSGNEFIDKLLRTTQVNPKHYYNVWEWIPYTQFMDIQFLDKGGFSTIESAIWLEGPRNITSNSLKSTIRNPNKKIVLKKLLNSRNNSKELAKELQIIHTYKDIVIAEIYGISQHPETGDYIIVMKYYENGDLKSLQHKTKLTWKEILILLGGINYGLETIHNAGFVHRDLHPGNIFPEIKDEFVYTALDVGFSIDFNKTSTSSKMYGIIPYVAPEVFLNGSYTKESDIYSFGIIMSEIVSGRPAFADRKHDLVLISEICNGKRPEVPQEIPGMYVELVNQCLSAEPSKRPSLEEISEKLKIWINEGTVIKEFDDNQINTKPLNQYHSGAIYKCDPRELMENTVYCENEDINSFTKESNLECVQDNSLKFGKNNGKCDPKELIEFIVYCENEDVDNFIKESNLKWIPYKSFSEIKEIGKALKQMHIPEDAISNMINERPKIKEINELLDHWNLILNYGPKYPEYKPGGYASLDDPFRYYKKEDSHHARLDAIEERRIVENKFSDYGSEFEEYKKQRYLEYDGNIGRNYYSYFDSYEERKQIQNEFLESDRINKSTNISTQIYESSVCTKWNFKQSISQALESLSVKG
ncbi:6790_t:CDS:2, partial [Racocetra fulgida]